jgi:hypothetical protein
MKNRRSFLKKALGLVGAMAFAQTADAKPKQQFIHHVYFWMRPEATPDEKEKLLKGIESLAKIETIRMSHIGVPAPTNREVIDRSYAFSWLAIFDHLAGQEAYQKHPVHLKFVEECSTLWTRVVVYDSVNAR